MSDLISRKDAIGAISRVEHIAELSDGDAVIRVSAVNYVLRNLPPAQPEHGKWIERESGTEDKESGFETVIACSCCDFPATTFYSENCESRTQIRTDFCPNCGADMRGEADDQ